MATTRIKDLSKTATTVASDANIVIDGSSNGTQKITRDNFRQDTADAFVAAPSTYKLAPLNGVNKIDGTYLPTSGDTPKGEWNASTNSPTLADGTGTAGDYYDVTTAGTANLGSGAITYTVGDVVKYNGATWFKIDSVANILDGAATAEQGRTTLDVNSTAQDAEATGTKLVSPSLYFDGTNDEILIADAPIWTFSDSNDLNDPLGTWSPDDNTPSLTDGTGTLNDHYRIDANAGTVSQGGSTLSIIDGVSTAIGQAVYYDGSVWRLRNVNDLPVTISMWVNYADLTNRPLIVKGAGGSTKEFKFVISSGDILRFQCYDYTQQSVRIDSDESMAGYDGKWVNLCVTYAGSGNDSAVAFSSAADAMTLYVNGQVIASTGATGNYLGLSGASQGVSIGRDRTAGTYIQGHIKECKIYNRSLTASEVVDSMNGDLGFADEFGGAFGGVYTSDFTSDSTDSWLASEGAVDATSTVGADTDNLNYTINTSASTSHFAYRNSVFTVGKRYRISLDAFIPSGQSNIDGFKVTSGGGNTFISETTPATGSWITVSGEAVANSTALYFQPLDGGSNNITDATGDDTFAIRNVKITEIGTLADFRSERFDSSTNKWYDLSDNAFIGTNSGATLVGREFPVYETGTWTPSVSFGGGSTGVTYGTQSGSYTRIGNQVTIHGRIDLTSKGSSNGDFRVTGLPFVGSGSAGSNSNSVTLGVSKNWSGLTVSPTSTVKSGDTQLYFFLALSTTQVQDTDVSDTLGLRFSITYQIQ